MRERIFEISMLHNFDIRQFCKINKSNHCIFLEAMYSTGTVKTLWCKVAILTLKLEIKQRPFESGNTLKKEAGSRSKLESI